MPQQNQTQTQTHEVFYEFAMSLKPINLVLTAMFLVYVFYKMASHPSGPAGGVAEAFEGLVWLMVKVVGLVDDLCMAAYRSLTALA